jgi:hypothetical protein
VNSVAGEFILRKDWKEVPPVILNSYKVTWRLV